MPTGATCGHSLVEYVHQPGSVSPAALTIQAHRSTHFLYAFDTLLRIYHLSRPSRPFHYIPFYLIYIISPSPQDHPSRSMI